MLPARPAPVQDLRTHYEAHLKAQGRPEIVVDLSGVGFAGSAALGNFVALQRLARQNGGPDRVLQRRPDGHRSFRASKLDSLFEFAADRPARSPRDQGAAPAARRPSENRPTAMPHAAGIIRQIPGVEAARARCGAGIAVRKSRDQRRHRDDRDRDWQ